jgi:hypothetical protein
MSVRNAAKIMLKQKIRRVPVVDGNGKALGYVTQIMAVVRRAANALLACLKQRPWLWCGVQVRRQPHKYMALLCFKSLCFCWPLPLLQAAVSLRHLQAAVQGGLRGLPGEGAGEAQQLQQQQQLRRQHVTGSKASLGSGSRHATLLRWVIERSSSSSSYGI